MGDELGKDTSGDFTDRQDPPWRPGLSTRILILTVLFVLFAETLIFLPSLANRQVGWLNERVEMAQTAVLALEAAPERMVSDQLSRRLLENAQIVAVAAGSDMGRESILSPAMEVSGDVAMLDLRELGTLPPIGTTVSILFDPDIEFIRVIEAPKFQGDFIEVLVETRELRSDLRTYANRILWLSLFISAFVGGLIYLSLVFLVVRPIRRITRSLERFRDDPRDWKSRIIPSRRFDEIGRAENTLADMEAAVKRALRERERLAQLGEAMAKINHDLRNSLTAAQIVSDGLSMSDDPRVKRAAPRLERAIERATTLAEETLKFGRSEQAEPNMGEHNLHDLAEEAAFEALAGMDGVMWINDLDPHLKAMVDADHCHRIFVNLIRNAGQALAAARTADEMGRIAIRRNGAEDALHLHLMDDGPGIPERVQERLFKPFSAANSRGGSGLGLAIARELAQGMGGDLRLLQTSDEGTVFELILMTH